MAAHMYDQSVELRASTCVRIISLCASVRVPLIDTLDIYYVASYADQINYLCHYSYFIYILYVTLNPV